MSENNEVKDEKPCNLLVKISSLYYGDNYVQIFLHWYEKQVLALPAVEGYNEMYFSQLLQVAKCVPVSSHYLFTGLTPESAVLVADSLELTL
jgi:hypothetical protein